MTNTLNRLDGRTLLAQSLTGCDDSARVLLGRFNKSVTKRGADHPQTVRLAGWLSEIKDHRTGADDPAPAAPERIEVDGTWYVREDVATKPKPRKSRGVSADTMEMVRLHNEGMTYEEIAVAMGRASGAVVGAAVRRGRKQLEG